MAKKQADEEMPEAFVSSALLSELGIASTSFMGGILGKQSVAAASKLHAASQSAMNLPPVPEGGETIHFLERCHALGAAGIQSQISGDPARLRARADELGMWVEAMISVRNSNPESLEEAIVAAKAAGCSVARDGLLGGRRYQTFGSLGDWNAWVGESMAKLEVAVPLFEKHKLTLALENHKDWTLDEYVGLFKSYSSEYFGACLDFGNNLSLLDDVMETIEQAAPYAKATHFKDVAVASCADGFAMAEVPLGTGILDLGRIVEVLERAQPKVRLALEMITRDPLAVPCLTDRYWVTFPDRNGIYLARTLRFVSEHESLTALEQPEALPSVEHAKAEEDNIRACIQWAHAHGNV